MHLLFHQPRFTCSFLGTNTGVANTSVVNLDADLVGLRWGYFDVLEGEILASLPGDGGLVAIS